MLYIKFLNPLRLAVFKCIVHHKSILSFVIIIESASPAMHQNLPYKSSPFKCMCASDKNVHNVCMAAIKL